MNWLCISNSIFVIYSSLCSRRKKKKNLPVPTDPHVQTMGRQWQTNNFLSLALVNIKLNVVVHIMIDFTITFFFSDMW